jgi:hypothetical protein
VLAQKGDGQGLTLQRLHQVRHGVTASGRFQ